MVTKISEVLHSEVDAVDMEATVSEVILLFSRSGHTSAPVVEADGKCFGVISAGDIFRLISDGGNVRAAKAWELCSHDVIFVKKDSDLVKAAQAMASNNVHHVVVLEEERVQGILSSLDIVRQVIPVIGEA